MSARQTTAKPTKTVKPAAANRKQVWSKKTRLLAGAVMLLALTGLLALRASDAATVTLAFEAEQGLMIGGATTIGDPSGTGASGGLVVQFRESPK